MSLKRGHDTIAIGGGVTPVYDEGSNEYGSWIRYKNGKMECTGELEVESVNFTFTYGPLFRCMTQEFSDFAKPFVGKIPKVVFNLENITIGGGFIVRWTGYEPTLISPGRVVVVKSADDPAGFLISYIARGQWK